MALDQILILSISAMAINWQYFNFCVPHNPEVSSSVCTDLSVTPIISSKEQWENVLLSPKSPICLLFVTLQCKNLTDTTASWSYKMLGMWSCKMTQHLGTAFLRNLQSSPTDFFPHAIAGVLVAYEGLPLHLALFPKLWTELCQTQVWIRTNRMETQAKHTECRTKNPQL